jgi:hypothetical protein
VFVITADQVDSRHRADIVDPTIERITAGWGKALLLPVDRTAGDELQLIVAGGDPALEIVLELTRRGEWSVGCGIGEVATPLPKNTREAAGSAFIAARTAVEAAKKRESRFALRAEGERAAAATDLESVVDLLLLTRARRSRQGWELYDIMGTEITQAEAAQRLGITQQAASKRARAAAIRAEQAAVPAIGRMLTAANGKEGSE